MSREPNVRAEFAGENGKYIIKISIVGDPNVYVGKVGPEDKARFPREWEAFIAGKPEPEVGGTPLTEVPGMTAELAKAYKVKGVRNAEELANTHDMGLSKLGLGAITMRKNAQILLKAQQTDRLLAAQASQATPEPPKRRGRPPKERTEVEDQPTQ